ncbi:MAG: cap, capsular polysaccharide biosynthsis protein [Parcubacteria group bacterium]|nr:cap, capsular polysaccharide biosynthsis protein [Parcubacteria group bacterium]
MISGDRHLLEPGNAAYERLQVQRDQVDQLDVFVWPQVHSKLEIWHAARKNHYDVITTQDPFWRGLLAWKIARLTGSKFNVQVHTDLKAQSFLRHVLAQIILRHADSVRVVSEKLKAQVKRINSTVSTHVLPIFIAVERFRSVVHIPSEQKRILWTGRFEEEKDPQLALQVVKDLRKQGIDPELIMLGTGSLESSLKQGAQGLNVLFPGWQDTAAYLAKADVVISTSKHESWGASIVEALAAKVPVVALDVGIAEEAGAIIATRDNFAATVLRVLQSGDKGDLKLKLYSKEEWTMNWKDSLL